MPIQNAPDQRKYGTGQAGFTLLEVMVALAVAAIALGALIHGIGQMAYQQQQLKTRVYGDWVAQEALLAATRLSFGRTDQTRVFSLAGQSWTVRYHRRATPIPRLYQLEIQVFPPGRQTPILTRATVIHQ